MNNFEYRNPTRIVFGKGQVAALDRLIAPEARVLILYGGGSVIKNGTLAEVKAALKGRTVAEFPGIEANPGFETMMKVVELVRREKYDFLLAVGGGSVIDGTKFVAAAVGYAGDPWDILQTDGKCITSTMPFGTVLTLPATGSEMNGFSVITRYETKTKLGFYNFNGYPVFSILDPTKTFTLPAKQVANGVVDAFIHTMEQYMTYPAQGLPQDYFAEGLLKTLIEIGPKAVAEPENYDIRANYMWTATLALNGLIAQGVPQDWATHMIGHEITALYGVDHGRTLAVVLPALLQNRRAGKREKLLQYATRVWNIVDGDDDARIDQAIAQTRAFFESLGVKTHLSDYGIGRDGIDKIIENLKSHGMLALGERQDITLDVSRTILEAAY